MCQLYQSPGLPSVAAAFLGLQEARPWPGHGRPVPPLHSTATVGRVNTELYCVLLLHYKLQRVSCCNRLFKTLAKWLAKLSQNNTHAWSLEYKQFQMGHRGHAQRWAHRWHAAASHLQQLEWQGLPHSHSSPPKYLLHNCLKHYWQIIHIGTRERKTPQDLKFLHHFIAWDLLCNTPTISLVLGWRALQSLGRQHCTWGCPRDITASKAGKNNLWSGERRLNERGITNLQNKKQYLPLTL